MIYITGDCHADFKRFTKKQRSKLPFELTEDDKVIVLGDFGLLWAKDDEFQYNLDWMSRLPFQILWIQGNHENYDMIAEYPLEEWNGGKVRHILRDKVILLERGQVFHIDGHSMFTFGGASSHDVSGGILDKDSSTYDEDRHRAVRSGLPFRIKNVSWWEQELPTDEEMQEGLANLEKVNYKVDFVLTHCLSTLYQMKLEDCYGHICGRYIYTADKLTAYFDKIDSKLQYKCWMCGHYHMDMVLDSHHIIFYKNIISLEEISSWTR